ncbi:hypothetical protein [Hyalangium rubrum]|uniref:DUF5683 domain-containing protein n=1 Tax=Hyalangium rubrum TaxID=3103134 RepID=A0ABU5H7A5_9BACT|nr:hypothetical protein [Hyalangium sp. s54d21]MDY7228733.1 hypothetical protein [Hyalangium sp. s54d21]
MKAAETKRNNAEAPPKSAQQQQEEAERDAAEQRARAEQAKQEVEKQLEAARKQQEEAQKALEETQKKPAGPEPELNLPIRYFVYSALLGGLGYATGLVSAGPERDLRDPAKHPTPDKTKSIYRRAYYGGLVSKGFYGLSGAMGGYAAYRTQSAVRQYLTAKARMAALQKEADKRLAQAGTPEERKAAEVTNALLVPPELVATEILVMPPEPPPLQAGFFVGSQGDASLSLSVRF